MAAQASRRALESAFSRWSAAAAANPQDPLGAVLAFYLSMEHREERMEGCPIVALGSDAARQGAGVKASFEAGIREYLELLGRWVGEADGEESERQGHGHSLDHGRCGAPLARRQRRAFVEAVPASGRRERADGVVCSRCAAGTAPKTPDCVTGAPSATVSISELAGWSGIELVARLPEGSIRRPPMAETLPELLQVPTRKLTPEWVSDGGRIERARVFSSSAGV